MTKRLIFGVTGFLGTVLVAPYSTQASLVFDVNASGYNPTTGVLTPIIGPNLVSEGFASNGMSMGGSGISAQPIVVTQATDNSSSALNFDGVSTAFDLTAPLVSNNGAYTVVAYVLPDLETLDTVGNRDGGALVGGTANALEYRITPVGYQDSLREARVDLGNSKSYIGQNDFSTVAESYNPALASNQISYYLNGNADGTVTNSSPFTQPISRFGAGAHAGNNDITTEYFAGAIAELQVYNTVLTPAQILAATNQMAAQYTASLSTPSSWATNASSGYNLTANWANVNGPGGFGAVPNGVDAEADFFGAITGNHTITTSIAITLGTLNFNNTNTYVLAGTSTLTMQSSSNAANIIVQAGTQEINLPLTFASSTTLNIATGSTLVISDPVTINTGLAVTTTGGGSVSFRGTLAIADNSTLTTAGSSYVHSLTMGNNTSLTVAAVTTSTTARSLLQTDSLTLGTGSNINLNNNDLLVHGGSLTTLNALVKSAYNSGLWTGIGITSGSAAASTTHRVALGVIQNSSTGVAGGAAIYSTFDGAITSSSDVLVKYTYYGDANLDGKVDGSDYSLIDNSFNKEQATSGLKISGWYNGDFNYDGVVDGSDYTLIDNAFNFQGSQFSGSSAALFSDATDQIAGSGSAVPEPATLGLLGLGIAGALGRRRRA